MHAWEHPTKKGWSGGPLRITFKWIHEKTNDPECLEAEIPEDRHGYTNTATPNHLCTEWIDSDEPHNDRCYRPIQDKGVCGVHLRKVLEEEARADDMRRANDEAAMRRELVRTVLEKLAEYGIEARLHYSGGMILVDPEALIGFLESQDQEMEMFS